MGVNQVFSYKMARAIVISALCVQAVDAGQVSLKPTPADQAELKHIVDEVGRIKGRGYTQTEAHLSVPSVQQLMNTVQDLARNKAIISQAMTKERELNDNYYVFYTAIPYMRLFQDVTRKLYKRKVGNIGALKDKSFQFVRYSYNDPVYSQYPDATDFLVKELAQYGIIDDNQVRLKTILVSTNLSLFGNLTLSGESTWNFFNHPQSWGVAPAAWLEASLKSFGYPPEYTKKLIALAPLTQDTQGDLFQIFVPHNLVDQIGYHSWRQGIPFDPEIIETWFERDPLILSKRGLYHEEIKERVYNIRRRWQAGDPAVKKLTELMIERARQGKYRLSTGIEAYKKTPRDVFEINHQQGRLLITNDMLLNPNSGIKIYRYSNLTGSKLAEYKRKLKHIFAEMDSYKKRLTGK